MEISITNDKKRTGPVLFSEYRQGEAIKKAIKLSREDILFEIKNSGLKGRGGVGSFRWQLNGCLPQQLMLRKNLLCAMQMKVNPGHLKTGYFCFNTRSLYSTGWLSRVIQLVHWKVLFISEANMNICWSS